MAAGPQAGAAPKEWPTASRIRITSLRTWPTWVRTPMCRTWSPATSITWKRRISGATTRCWPSGRCRVRMAEASWRTRSAAMPGGCGTSPTRASSHPTANPEAEYFAERIHNNLAELTAKMLGPPEYNRLGFWGLRTVDDARIQNAANPRWMITAPWEHDFLIWSLHHLTELGYTDAARPRDFELRWRVGVFTHPGEYNPLLGAPYRMAVGETGAGQAADLLRGLEEAGRRECEADEDPRFAAAPLGLRLLRLPGPDLRRGRRGSRKPPRRSGRCWKSPADSMKCWPIRRGGSCRGSALTEVRR